MQDGATFALVAQPAVLAVAPGTSSIHEVEDGSAVFLVEFLDFRQTGFHHLIVPRHVFVGTCGGIADEGIEEVLGTALQTLSLAGAVDVGEIVNLQLFQQLDGPGLVLQDGRHDDHGGVFLRDQAVLEFNFKGVDRLVYLIKQLVEEVDDDLAHWHPHQDGEDDGEPDVASGAESEGPIGEAEGQA